MPKTLLAHIEKLQQNRSILRDVFKIKRIGIFGSTARGENTPKSDLDIVIELREPISIFKFLELENYLEKILGKKVDLTTAKGLKKTIKRSVLNETVYA